MATLAPPRDATATERGAGLYTPALTRDRRAAELSLLIRPAVLADVATARQIVQDAYALYIPRLGKPLGPMLDDYHRRVRQNQAWVTEDQGAIVGLLVLEDAPDGTLLLDNVAVAPRAQGKGIGRALVNFAEDEARRRGHNEVRLYTNAVMTENIALYQRLGFRETARVTEKGFNRVYMAKALF